MLWKPHIAIEIIFPESERETALHMKHDRLIFGRIECLGAIHLGTLVGFQLQVASDAWRTSSVIVQGTSSTSALG